MATPVSSAGTTVIVGQKHRMQTTLLLRPPCRLALRSRQTKPRRSSEWLPLTSCWKRGSGVTSP